MTPTPSRKIGIFGATGRTGRNVLKTLLLQQDNSLSLHLFVRSAARLEALVPNIRSRPNVEISEGTFADREALANTLRGASLIICTVGSNDNEPGMTVFRDIALAIASTLAQLQSEVGSTWTRPHLTILSSASTYGVFTAKRPRLLEWLLGYALNHVYDDLRVGEQILSSFPFLMTITLIHAPLIVDGERTGYKISAESEGTCVCYSDLGEAMAKISLDPQIMKLNHVGVQSVKVVKSPFQLWRICITNLTKGLLGRHVPGYWATSVRHRIASFTIMFVCLICLPTFYMVATRTSS